MNSKSHLVHQPMEQRDHFRHHIDQDKIDSSMPTFADCATAASTNNTTESNGPNLATPSAFADLKQIAALMTSTATMATEASSIAPSIETTFLGAVASLSNENLSEATTNTSGKIESTFLQPRTKELHHYALAMDIVGDLDDHSDNTISESSNHDDTNDEVQSFQAQDDNEERFLSSLTEGLEFITRSRKSEKHVFALAEFLLDDSDHQNEEN